MGRIPGAGAAKTGCPVECVYKTQKRPRNYSHKGEIPTYGETAGNIKMISKIVAIGTIMVPWEETQK